MSMDSEVNKLKLRDECGINADPLHKPTADELMTAEQHAREFVRRCEQLRREREQELKNENKAETETKRVRENNPDEMQDQQRTV